MYPIIDVSRVTTRFPNRKRINISTLYLIFDLVQRNIPYYVHVQQTRSLLLVLDSAVRMRPYSWQDHLLAPRTDLSTVRQIGPAGRGADRLDAVKENLLSK
jgi:hypothetical protein